MRRPCPLPFRFALTLGLLLGGVLSAQDYERTSKGTRILSPAAGGLEIKVLVEPANFGGGEVEVGEITFPADGAGGPHVHQSHEIFYVLSGTMRHVVNGVAAELGPGEVAIVRKGDTVEHHVVGDEPVTALVIWAPGGEVARLSQFFESRPVP